MSKTYLTLGNTVIVESVKPDSTIQFPSTYQPENYTVVSVGDVVILNPAASLVPIKDTNYSIVNVNDVLAIVIDE